MRDQKANFKVAVTVQMILFCLDRSLQNSDTLLRVLRQADRACGYVFGSGEERNMEKLLSSAIGAELTADRLGTASEEFVDIT